MSRLVAKALLITALVGFIAAPLFAQDEALPDLDKTMTDTAGQYWFFSSREVSVFPAKTDIVAHKDWLFGW